MNILLFNQYKIYLTFFPILDIDKHHINYQDKLKFHWQKVFNHD